ncbi:hypothetical protein HK102_007107 [Quaeritorhiza haematococci]|nr:hypothetical protein HK102_007107 [Quaeritorhiza haematococci]
MEASKAQWTAEAVSMFQLFQIMDEKRLNFLRESMIKYSNLDTGHCKTRSSIPDKVLAAAISFDVPTDIETFCSTKGNRTDGVLQAYTPAEGGSSGNSGISTPKGRGSISTAEGTPNATSPADSSFPPLKSNGTISHQPSQLQHQSGQPMVDEEGYSVPPPQHNDPFKIAPSSLDDDDHEDGHGRDSTKFRIDIKNEAIVENPESAMNMMKLLQANLKANPTVRRQTLVGRRSVDTNPFPPTDGSPASTNPTLSPFAPNFTQQQQHGEASSMTSSMNGSIVAQAAGHRYNSSISSSSIGSAVATQQPADFFGGAADVPATNSPVSTFSRTPFDEDSVMGGPMVSSPNVVVPSASVSSSAPVASPTDFGSFESSANPPLAPANITLPTTSQPSSQLPSPVHLDLHVTETINVLMKAGVVDKLLVVGEVSVSAAALASSSSSASPPSPSILHKLWAEKSVRIRIKGARGVLEKMIPNASLAAIEASSSSPSPSQQENDHHEDALVIKLGALLPSSSDAPTPASVPVLKYQVKANAEVNPQAYVPLYVSPFWKIEEQMTSLLVAYKGNEVVIGDAGNDGGVDQEGQKAQPKRRRVTLNDVSFLVNVNGAEGSTGFEVKNVQTKPFGIWNPERKALLWKVGDLGGQVSSSTSTSDATTEGRSSTSSVSSTDGGATGAPVKLLARFETTTRGAPGPVAIKFAVKDALLSGLEFVMEPEESAGEGFAETGEEHKENGVETVAEPAKRRSTPIEVADFDPFASSVVRTSSGAPTVVLNRVNMSVVSGTFVAQEGVAASTPTNN